MEEGGGGYSYQLLELIVISYYRENLLDIKVNSYLLF
jgi:hypothetical protein